MPEPATDVREYDPALAEGARLGEDDDEVSIIARVSDVSALPAGVTVVTQFGDVVTLRVRRSQIAALADSAAVLAMEATYPFRPTWDEADASDLADLEVPEDDTEPGEPAAPAYVRRPAGLTATGRGVVVAVLDWGCDFAHPAFRNADGSTRLLAVWDQRGRTPDGQPNRWGYGRILGRADIDRALAGPHPYEDLGYDPADADPPEERGRPGPGSHGTHVLDIAAGNGRGGGEPGVAPEADLVFVHLAGTADVLERTNLGDSASVLEALDFVFRTAGARPCVVNMSVGAHGGPHDGTTLVEQGIDRAVWLASGRVVVNSAGNYFRTRAHAQGRIATGGEALLPFSVPADDPTASEVELWYAGADRFEVAVLAPDGSELARLRPGAEAALVVDGRTVGHVYHVRQAENRDHQVDLFLQPRAPSGRWALRIRGEQASDGRFHAWIERDRGPSPRFARAAAATTCTTGTLCNGRFSITVGAYDPHRRHRPLGGFSSAGPTRDGRVKPEIIAPGVGIRAARSTPAGGAPGPLYTRKSGTSMAAPHVVGTIALMCEAVGRPLDIAEVRALLLGAAERVTNAASGADLHRYGSGYLDIVAAERAAADWGRSHAAPRDGRHAGEQAAEPGAPVAPEGLIEQAPEGSFFDGRDGEPAAVESAGPASFRRSLWSLAEGAAAWPGQHELVDLAASALGLEASPRLLALGRAAGRLEEMVRPGDLLVRSSPAEGVHHTAVVVSGPELRGDLELRGVPVEAGGRGLYVEVAEAPFEGGALRSVGRRLTDAWGRVPHGQMVLRASGRPLFDAAGEDAGDACPWWLPEDRSSDYFTYAQPQTWGRATLLINGRSSGGAGPNVDRSEPFDMMQHAVEGTNPGDAVYLAAWMFDPETKLTRPPLTRGLATWGDLMAAKAERGVTFRLLLNDFPALMKWKSNFKALDALVLGLPAGKRDNVKYVLSRHPAHVTVSEWEAKLLTKASGLPITAGAHHLAVHHQKFMVVRYSGAVTHMTAFCGGVDIIPGMTPRQWSKTPWHGWHDLQVRLEGPITRDLEKEFVWRWNRERTASRRRALPGWSAHEVLTLTSLTKAEAIPGVYRTAMQMLRTVSDSKGDSLTAFAVTRRGDVRRAYEHGIACANQFLYLENQYYRAPELADWIVARGTQRPNLIVIIVVVHPGLAEADDGKNPFTDHGIFLQFQTFDRIVKGLGADRVRFYEMHKRYVHSKLIAADDHWWCIGSANVNGRGFGLDSELNVQIREPDPEALPGFRRKLWAHNLGVSEATVGGWPVSDFIANWDAVAKANAGKARDAMQGEGVLRFDHTKFPGAHLPMVPDLLASVGLPGSRSRDDRVA